MKLVRVQCRCGFEKTCYKGKSGIPHVESGIYCGVMRVIEWL